MKLSISIALRFLKSNLSQTIIIILGIGIGVAVQIFIGSLIQGLQNSLVDKTIGNSSQITISSEKDYELIEDYQRLMNQIEKEDTRIQNISPVLDSPAFLESGSSTQSVLIRGFDLTRADKIYKFSDYMVEGVFPEYKGEIILSTSLKEKYTLVLGDKINLITTDKKTVSTTVVGFFDLKVSQINESWCVTTLETSQEIAGTSDVVSSVEMQVLRDEVFEADEIAQKITNKIDNNSLKVQNWKVQNEQLLSGLQGQSISSLMIQIFVMISVVLGIASVLAITVMQKSRQIGILKAMGIKNRTSSMVFLTEGFVLGIFGALTGVTFGIGLSAAFTTFALNSDGTPVVPLYISESFILLSAVIAILACMAASLIPAIKSSKLDPIEIIRNN